MVRSPADLRTSPPLGTPAQRDAALDLLRRETLAPLGLLRNASNGTLLVRLGAQEPPVHAVYKPRAGERPLWDFPPGTLSLREVAAFEVSEFLGWHVVPPTVWRTGPAGAGSVQLFIGHDPREHYFTLVADRDHHAVLARMALYDLLVNNADRKASHVLRDPTSLVLGVDHGLTFHVEPKLRTVIWELGGYELAPGWRADLRRLAEALLAEALEEPSSLHTAIADLLAPDELELLGLRAAALADMEALPALAEDERPYPWPLL